MHELNVKLFYLIYNLHGNHWLDSMAVFTAEYLIFVMLVALIFYYILGRTPEEKEKNKMMVIMACLAGILDRFVITEAFKIFLYSPRPFTVLGVTSLIPEWGNSFPSGHTIFLFGVSTIIYFYNKNLSMVFFALSLVVGLARIYTGVHWPGDVLWGIIFGIASSLLFYKYARQYVYRYIYKLVANYL